MALAPTHTLLEVPLKLIRVNPFQPRRSFDKDELAALAKSIQAVGIIHPPTVRSIGDGEHYELIAGERRYRAAQLAGLDTIPVVIKQADQNISAEAALIENVQRVDLNPIEVAEALQRLMREFHLTQDEVAKKIGKKRPTVANYLRLLTLPRSIQAAVSGGELSMGHAKVVLSLPESERQLRLHERILRDTLTVREAEQIVQRQQGREPKMRDKSYTMDLHLLALENELQSQLGYRASIRGTPKRGRVSFEYHSMDELNRLLDHLGVSL